ncbi:MAG: CoA-binding protein [Paracoccus sp. (in: a-proteobacteria)]|uniref:CoA-binding protein n=1 Tax=Paracoccus sp. TaxID=267 RepID=UPI0026E0DFDD|nr:CoA-binding protein [Paracoccus sp. (in: a-proteobacteria)]MDO5632876.1 CoA-binding protein [Paracoccus sp. (in: a-proteobacteria)]
MSGAILLQPEDTSEEDAVIAQIARQVKVVAVVGLSPNADRPSWGVARYLQSCGMRVIPVNPGHAGATILNETVYPDLAAIPADAEVQMVDIFRRSDAVAAIVDEAMAHLSDLRVIWTQIGVRDDAAAQRARDAGLTVIQDRCPKIEFPRHL